MVVELRDDDRCLFLRFRPCRLSRRRRILSLVDELERLLGSASLFPSDDEGFSDESEPTEDGSDDDRSFLS